MYALLWECNLLSSNGRSRTRKGRAASVLDIGNGLLLVEVLYDQEVHALPVHKLVGMLAAFTIEESHQINDGHAMTAVLDLVDEKINRLQEVYNRHNIAWRGFRLARGFAGAVQRWLEKSTDFDALLKDSRLEAGIAVRGLQRLDRLLGQASAALGELQLTTPRSSLDALRPVLRARAPLAFMPSLLHDGLAEEEEAARLPGEDQVFTEAPPELRRRPDGEGWAPDRDGWFVELDPHEVGFSHNTISCKFSDGRRLEDTVAELVEDEELCYQLAKDMRVVYFQGRPYTLGNRRLAAFRLACQRAPQRLKKLCFQLADEAAALRWKWWSKFSTGHFLGMRAVVNTTGCVVGESAAATRFWPSGEDVPGRGYAAAAAQCARMNLELPPPATSQPLTLILPDVLSGQSIRISEATLARAICGLDPPEKRKPTKGRKAAPDLDLRERPARRFGISTLAKIPAVFPTLEAWTTSFGGPLLAEVEEQILGRCSDDAEGKAKEPIVYRKAWLSGVRDEERDDIEDQAINHEDGDVFKIDANGVTLSNLKDWLPFSVLHLRIPGMACQFGIVAPQGSNQEGSLYLRTRKLPVLQSLVQQAEQSVEVKAGFVTCILTELRICRAMESPSQHCPVFWPSIAGADTQKISLRAHGTQQALVSDIRQHEAALQRSSLNQPQIGSVLTTLRRKEGVVLIQGPPGTGKTKTLSVLLDRCVAVRQRCLVVAPTNTAVQELLSRVLEHVAAWRIGYVAHPLTAEVARDHDLACVLADHRVAQLHELAADVAWTVDNWLQAPARQPPDSDDEYAPGKAKGRGKLGKGKVKGKSAGEERRARRAQRREDWGSKLFAHAAQVRSELRHFQKTLERWRSQLLLLPPEDSGVYLDPNREPSPAASAIEQREEEAMGQFGRLRDQLQSSQLPEELSLLHRRLEANVPRTWAEAVANPEKLYEWLQGFVRRPTCNGYKGGLGWGCGSLGRSGKGRAPFGPGSKGSAAAGPKGKCSSDVEKATAVLRALREAARDAASVKPMDLQDALLRRCELIFCTAAVAGRGAVQRQWVQTVLIDEACQLAEAVTIVPLRSSIQRLVLVGDPRQLPALVLSRAAEHASYGRGMFQRLVSIGERPEVLEIQYRMHRDVVAWPANHFYRLDGIQLRTGPSVIARDELQAPPLLGPARFVHVSGVEQRSGHSWLNEDEAALVVEQARLLRALHPSLSIGVITPYLSQVKEVQWRLADADLTDVQVSSVDGFQGDERDAILVSPVRSNSKQHIGFVGDAQRLNVAVTRPKHFLWIFGNKETLGGSEHWSSLLEFYEEKGWIVAASDLKAKAKGKGGGKSNAKGKKRSVAAAGSPDTGTNSSRSPLHGKARVDAAVLELTRRGDWTGARRAAKGCVVAWVARGNLLDTLGFRPSLAHVQRCVFAEALADLQASVHAEPSLAPTKQAWEALQSYCRTGNACHLRAMPEDPSVFSARGAAIAIRASHDPADQVLAAMRKLARDGAAHAAADALGWRGAQVWQFGDGSFTSQAEAAVRSVLAYSWLATVEALEGSSLQQRAEAIAATAALHAELEPRELEVLSAATEACAAACLEAGSDAAGEVLGARGRLPDCRDGRLRAQVEALLGRGAPVLRDHPEAWTAAREARVAACAPPAFAGTARLRERFGVAVPDGGPAALQQVVEESSSALLSDSVRGRAAGRVLRLMLAAAAKAPRISAISMLDAFRLADASGLLCTLNPPSGRFADGGAATPAETWMALQLLFMPLDQESLAELLAEHATPTEEAKIMLEDASVRRWLRSMPGPTQGDVEAERFVRLCTGRFA
ncbi:unnamed protein product [Prorocentrum cordatum]|uniref:ATP-dependent RNA helicase Ski2/MTR4 C-terminal domain-containing protein n=1 Tax=Prorocentrum cordatum TaxID=2364126 RepID=A0ABN9PHI1_9DINO|nr:unnamed protein product [Polarella glacialis]